MIKHKEYSIHEVEKLFHDFMQSVGLNPIKHCPVADGQIHRFQVDGDRSGSRNGWYVLHHSPQPVGVCGSWKQDSKHVWYGVDDGDSLSKAALKRLQASIEKALALRNQEIERRQQEVAVMCLQQWDSFLDADPSHPYLQAKGVGSYGLRQNRQSLFVPIYAVDGQLYSWQKIEPDGSKRFMKDGRIKGCFHTIGAIEPEQTTIFIAEGYATAATVYEQMSDVMEQFVDTGALPDPANYACVVAFNAGNLFDVARTIRQQYKLNRIVIVADNDHHTEGNPGLTKAKLVKQECNAQLIMPEFDPTESGTDFNDFFNDRQG